MRAWWSKVLQRFHLAPQADSDINAEIRAHLDFLTQENIASGMPPEEAAAAARRDFGNPTAVQERAREAWHFPAFESVLQDLRQGLRGIRRSPGFSLVVILTLALGIGANTAIFSVVYAVLLKPLPYPHGERLVELQESTPSASGISVTWVNFQDWRKLNHSFVDMAGFHTADFTLTGRGDAILTHSALVTHSFFRLTGSRPLLGRLFTRADDHPGAAPTVLLSYEFWAKKLAGNPAAIGGSLALDGKSYEVIGVLPPGLKFFPHAPDYYLPLGLFDGNIIKRSQHGSMRVLALLKPGVTLAQGRADLDGIMRRLAIADPGPEDDHRAAAEFLTQAITGDIRLTLWVLMGAVGLVLIIACANIASLLLARSSARTREIAIRSSIGAGRGRLVRQLLTENLVTAGIGGTLGVLLAGACLRLLIATGPRNIPRLSEVSLDTTVLLFAAAITIAVGLLAALAPALAAGRVDLNTALKEGSPAASGGRRGSSFRSGLVVAEIAITLVLAFASGLLLRSLIAAQTRDPGFDPHNVLALQLQLPSTTYKSKQEVRQFYGRLTQDLRREPGVDSVGAVNCPIDDCGDWWYSILGKPVPRRSDVPLLLTNIAGSDYFRTMRIPVIAGRVFSDSDLENGPRVAVINEEIARRWWPSPQRALGEQLKLGGPYMPGPVYNIVGVVGSTSQMGLDEPRVAQMYVPFSQSADRAMVVMIRAHGDPERLAPAVKQTLALIDRNVPIQSLRPFDAWLGTTLARRRFSTLLLASFAALAILLAAVGIYGVLNYWISVRQKEIAVRMALGAQQPAILRWAGSHALRLAAIGIVIGAAGAWAASAWLKSMVFGVSVHSPAIMLVAAALIVGLALAAAAVPLWRAIHVDAFRNLHDA